MTIINDEFVTLSCGYTIRTGSIVALCIDTGYVWVEGIGHILVEEPAEILRLHAHWIRVISARMGIYHEPVVVPTVVPPAQVKHDDAEHYSPNIIAAMKRYDWSDAQFEELVDWMCRFDPGITKLQRVARVNVTERAVLEDLRNGYDAFCVARKAITDFGDGVPV